MTTKATLSVKNFERFQHYKDRNPPWIKLYNDLLDDYAFGQLSDENKWSLVAIWLLASRYSNAIPADAAWISRRINAHKTIDLGPLIEAGFIVSNQELTPHDSEALAECKQTAMPETERETERETETEGEKERERQKKKGFLLPIDWKPNEGFWNWAEKKGHSVDLCNYALEEMQDWAQGNSNRAITRKSDWNATLRTFVRRKAESGQGNGRGPSQNPLMAAADELIDELKQKERMEGHGRRAEAAIDITPK